MFSDHFKLCVSVFICSICIYVPQFSLSTVDLHLLSSHVDQFYWVCLAWHTQYLERIISDSPIAAHLQFSCAYYCYIHMVSYIIHNMAKVLLYFVPAIKCLILSYLEWKM